MEQAYTARHDRSAIYYTEDRCALRWPVWFHGIAAPALAITLLVLAVVAGAPGLGVLDIFAWFWAFAGLVMLAQSRPTGLRVDATGIRIGGVRRAERQSLTTRLQRKPLPVSGQRSAVFLCPWDAVWRLAVVADRGELRDIRRRARADRGGRQSWLSSIPLGWLSAPFMRACLIIHVVPGRVSKPPLRPVKRRGNWLDFGVLSPTWLVPTRHPVALLAALRRIPGCVVDDHLRLDAPIALYGRRQPRRNARPDQEPGNTGEAG
jgi:hypothetical protein